MSIYRMIKVVISFEILNDGLKEEKRYKVRSQFVRLYAKNSIYKEYSTV